MPKVELSIDQIQAQILSGNRGILSQAITLVESKRKIDKEKASELVLRLSGHENKSLRIGITGSPGAGKSTFINEFAGILTQKQKSIAVLAIDPSSNISGGSILGDKTRMESLVSNKNVFIRPSPSSGELGGVGASTYETILLCEAAGFDYILVETVGVGQSESSVYDVCDLIFYLTLAGGGDELQGIKRGILEHVDAIILNKTDLLSIDLLNDYLSKLQFAIQFFTHQNQDTKQVVLSCSSINGQGFEKIVLFTDEFLKMATESGWLLQKRERQKLALFEKNIERILKNTFFENSNIQNYIQGIKTQLKNGNIGFVSAQSAIREYIETIIKP